MDILDPDRIEAAAAEAGMSINALCRRAGVARSIFTRWKNGRSAPSVENVNRLIAAINAAKEIPPPE